jgi:hypothetical protein
MSDELSSIYMQALTLARRLNRAERSRLLAVLSAELSSEISDLAEDRPTSEPAPIITMLRRADTKPEDVHEMMDGPLVLVDRPGDPHSPLIIPNGIDQETGNPLLVLDAASARRIAVKRRDDTQRPELHRERVRSGLPKLGMVYGRSYEDLRDAGWAMIVHAHDDADIIKALWPLIRHRSEEQGISLPAVSFRPDERCSSWLARHGVDLQRPWHPRSAVRLPIFLYETGTSCTRWLAQHGTQAETVDPTRGVPFYLLIAGRPGPIHSNDHAYISYDFQYDLDIFWGVGRVCFTRSDGMHSYDDYTAYAEQVVQFEQRAPVPTSRHIVYFATRHKRDLATQASEEELVLPIAHGMPADQTTPLSGRFGFTQAVFNGEQATRAMLRTVLEGSAPGGRPSLLFTATHGAGLRLADPLLPEHQGALICADWSGAGTVKREHWMAADDLSDHFSLEGLIALCFACYSAGCPATDQYAVAAGRMRQIAPRELVAKLPQQLLAHGALAVIGHIDRAWNYSFSIPELGVHSQTQGFEDLLGRLMDGGRAGFATDQFNMRQAAFASALSDLVRRVTFAEHNPDFGLDEIRRIWTSFQDARSYTLLGDPAVRLPKAHK